MKSEYVLVSRWTVAVSRERLWDELETLLETSDPLPWWPSVQVVGYDGDNLDLRALSGLGYAVRFRLAELETQRPERLAFTADGDLDGRGEVRFVALGPTLSAMDIDWRVATRKRWMRRFAWVLRPIFIVGHHLVMRRGERHLNRWLDARATGQSPQRSTK